MTIMTIIRVDRITCDFYSSIFSNSDLIIGYGQYINFILYEISINNVDILNLGETTLLPDFIDAPCHISIDSTYHYI
jgi:hypothetical protein